MPLARGKRRGVARIFSITLYPALSRKDPRDTRPNWSRPLSLHRSSPSGGSETMSRPPISRNRTAHSAVTAGGPNDRAVTRLNRESPLVSRASSSARPLQTLPPLGTSSHASASRRKFDRFSIESRNVVGCAHVSRSTSPGSPPPLPRSRIVAGGSGRREFHAATKPFACWICGSMEPGPKKPRALDSSRARVNHCDVTSTTMPERLPRSDEALHPRTG